MHREIRVEYDFGLCVSLDEGEAVLRVFRIEWQVCGTGLQYSEHGGDHLQAALEGDSDARPTSQAQTAKVMGQLVRAPIQLSITDPLVFEDQGDSIRRRRRLTLE